MKFSATIIASAIAAASILPDAADAHAFLLLPKTDFLIPEKNFYAYIVPGEKVPPFSSYTTGDAERNSQGFTASYKKLAPASLKAFILANQVQATGDTVAKSKGTAACGFSKPDGPAQPLPDHIEFGNYNVQSSSGLHPGPCEAWCDDEIVIPFTEDCRKLFQKPIPYAKDKCVGKSRFTFYWLATHFAPFQVYIGCAPLQGGSGGGGGGGGGGSGRPGNSGGNSTAPAGGNGGGGNGGGGNGGGNNGGGNNGGNNNNRPGGNNNNGGGNQNNGNNNNRPNNGGNNNGANNNGGNTNGANNNNQNRNNGANNNNNRNNGPNNNNRNNGRSLDFGFLQN